MSVWQKGLNGMAEKYSKQIYTPVVLNGNDHYFCG